MASELDELPDQNRSYHLRNVLRFRARGVSSGLLVLRPATLDRRCGTNYEREGAGRGDWRYIAVHGDLRLGPDFGPHRLAESAGGGIGRTIVRDRAAATGQP